MSVSQYYPFYGSKNRIRMGLCTIPASEWIEYEQDFIERIEEKCSLIHNTRERVIQCVAGSEEAQNELLANILCFIQQYHNDLFIVNEMSIIRSSDNTHYDFANFKEHPLELISYLVPDDFCLLEKCDDDYRLVAASVCAPTYWELTEKIGHPMKEVHAPIAQLEERIGRMIRHFFAGLKPDDYYQRSNWFLMPTSDLALFKDRDEGADDMSDLGVSNIMNKLYLRCERQSFRKLPQTETIAFGIKIYVSPLNIVEKHSSIAEDLILSIDAMSEDQKQLFGIHFYENTLREYLHSVLK